MCVCVCVCVCVVGWQVVPWLELLDLKKWPVVTSVSTSASSSIVTGEGPAHPVFVFPLNSEGDVLSVSSEDINHVARLVALSRLARVEADELHSLFDSEAQVCMCVCVHFLFDC